MGNNEAYGYLRSVLLNERMMRKRVFRAPGKELMLRRKIDEIDKALDALDVMAKGAGVATAAEAQRAQLALFP